MTIVTNTDNYLQYLTSKNTTKGKKAIIAPNA